jgi:hypothetical protein
MNIIRVGQLLDRLFTNVLYVVIDLISYDISTNLENFVD